MTETKNYSLRTQYYMIRNRLTGLFLKQNDNEFVWIPDSGTRFKTKSSLKSFFKECKIVPKEWEIVPIELKVRFDRRMNASSYFNIILQKEEKNKKMREEADVIRKENRHKKIAHARKVADWDPEDINEDIE